MASMNETQKKKNQNSRQEIKPKQNTNVQKGMTKSLKNWLRMKCAAKRHKYTKTWSDLPSKNDKIL